MNVLNGITVVALEQAVAAPFASRQLADLGARVIKIEREEGDFARDYDRSVRGMSSYFVWLNRSKESVVLDLKTPEGKSALQDLVAGADVFIQNLAPGAAARLGFGASELRRRHASLIVCSISGFGEDGPNRDRRAYDLLMQSEMGLLSITGTHDSPARVGVPIADIAAGMYAYSGILTALYRRQQTGVGATLHVSLFDSLAEWMGSPLYFTAFGGAEPERSGPHHPTITPYGPYECGDGKSIFVAVQNDREWQRFCSQVIGQTELAGDPRFASIADRLANRADLDRAIHTAFAAIDVEEAARRLEAAAIANARMNTVTDLVSHRELSERGRWVQVDSPVGPLDLLKPPVRLDGIEPVMGSIPALGGNTDAVLAEIGRRGA
jgi:itaconate CoA-transferase